MGPPPVPSHQPFSPSSLQNSKDPRDISEKYYKLKRKYWELEEVTCPYFIPVFSLSLIHPSVINRNTRTSRRSSNVRVSEMLIGVLKKGM
jgi:hypothetical protein